MKYNPHTINSAALNNVIFPNRASNMGTKNSRTVTVISIKP